MAHVLAVAETLPAWFGAAPAPAGHGRRGVRLGGITGGGREPGHGVRLTRGAEKTTPDSAGRRGLLRRHGHGRARALVAGARIRSRGGVGQVQLGYRARALVGHVTRPVRGRDY